MSILTNNDYIINFNAIVETFGSKAAFHFLADGENEKDHLTYFELNQRAKSIAVALTQLTAANDRVILCYLPSLDFICAFFGCLYAHRIAVPVFPMQNSHHAQRLYTILSDCQPSLIMGTTKSLTLMKEQEGFTSFQYLETDTLSAADELNTNFIYTPASSNDIAFLQYTSGSTGLPKGVMVSQDNIVTNMHAIQHSFGLSSSKNTLSWLPMQHDMGLIGQILSLLYVGSTTFFMPPASFIEKPIRWLKGISDYHIAISGGPNFAYQLCVDKIAEEELEGIDLSCWKVAFNGSEPIRANTVQAFSKKFARCGFNPAAILPCYGMAETTLLVSGKQQLLSPTYTTIDQKALALNRFEKKPHSTQVLVSSGQIDPQFTVKIVNPETKKVANPHEIGEIWVHGSSVAKGYWHKPELTQDIFAAQLANDDKQYLRTGDLGYLDGAELYVTGRLKDLIILQGRNVYPQDIEKAVEACHPAIRIGYTAAFSVENHEQEQLIIVAEVERMYRKIDFKPVFQAIRRVVIDTSEAITYSIHLLAPAKSLKTTSGKIQRKATKELFLSGKLEVLATDDLSLVMESTPVGPENIADKLCVLLAKLLGLAQVEKNEKFTESGYQQMIHCIYLSSTRLILKQS